MEEEEEEEGPALEERLAASRRKVSLQPLLLQEMTSVLQCIFQMAASVLSHKHAGFVFQAGLEDINKQRENAILRENLILEMDMNMLSMELNEYSLDITRVIDNVASDRCGINTLNCT